MSSHRTITDQCHEWIGHMRGCDNRQPCQQEQIRLSHDQAMRLCFEMACGQYETAERKTRAMAAYSARRPWDFLAGARLFGHLVPLNTGERG